MNIVGLDDREYSWNLSLYRNNQRATASAGHVKARTLLKELFPFDAVLEELTLPGLKPKLFADFFIASQMLMVEVNGRQHYEYVPFFHKTKHNYFKALRRDALKGEWCVKNHICLMSLNDEESVDEWRNQILQREA